MGKEIKTLSDFWKSERWSQTTRPYTKEDVTKLSPSYVVDDYTLANYKSRELWNMLKQENQIYGMSASTVKDAVQQVEAGMDIVCLDNYSTTTNTPTSIHLIKGEQNYVSDVVNGINNLFQEGCGSTPIVAKTKEMNFKLMTEVIKSGAAGVWFGDQSTFAKQYGTGVMMSTKKMVNKLTQARLAADVCMVPSVIVACTNSNTASLIECNTDDTQDQKFITSKECTSEGYQYLDTKLCTKIAIERGLAYAPYADVLCLEANSPNIDQARKFAEAIHKEFPEKFLAYNCSSNFDWTSKFTATELQNFQDELTNLGYALQCICPRVETYYSMCKLAESYCDDGFVGYANLEEIFCKVDNQTDYNAFVNKKQEEPTLV